MHRYPEFAIERDSPCSSSQALNAIRAQPSWRATSSAKASISRPLPKASRPGIDTYPPEFGRGRHPPFEPKHAGVTAGQAAILRESRPRGRLLSTRLFSFIYVLKGGGIVPLTPRPGVP